MASRTQAAAKRPRRKGRRKHGPDRGTPEAQARRRALVGDANPALAEYPLGILLARGFLSPEQHDAGCHYAYLAGRVLGRTKPYRADAAGGGLPLAEEAQGAVERRWHQAVAVLLEAGRRAKDAVDNAAIFERLPGWLLRADPRPGDERERQALLAGLDGLAQWRAGRLRPVIVAQAAE